MAGRPPKDQFEPAIAALSARYGLGVDAQRSLLCLATWLLMPEAPTSIRTPLGMLNDHMADSLVALDLDVMRSARTVLDLGSGAGIPGIPLAIALPVARFTLLEAAAPKARFLTRVVDDCRVANADVVHSRAESFAARGRQYDIVTARAVGPLNVVLEYGAPLLRLGGTLVVWRGRRESAVEVSARRAAEELGLGALSICPVKPYRGAQHRHLYTVSKLRETPARYPRRPGLAIKRPLA